MTDIPAASAASVSESVASLAPSRVWSLKAIATVMILAYVGSVTIALVATGKLPTATFMSTIIVPALTFLGAKHNS